MTSQINDSAELGEGLHITLEPSIAEWTHGQVRESLVIPAGGITDFSTIPYKGVKGWVARKLGFDKNAKWFRRSGKIHDPLYFAIKYWNGILPHGWFQFLNPNTNQWEPVIAHKWTREAADSIWRRVSIEDGCDPKVAERGYRLLRMFGGIHMMIH